MVKVGDYMACCPHCGLYVPYFSGRCKPSLILQNFFRAEGDEIYTCDMCDKNYRLSLFSQWVPGLIACSFLGFIIFLCDKIPALNFLEDHIGKLMIAFLIIVAIGDYIWWRYFTQLEAEY